MRFRRAAQRLLHQDVDGRRLLLKSLPKHSVGAEVGVWQGDFSQRILRTVKPRMLYLIDPWTFSHEPDVEGAWYAGAIAKSQADMDGIAQKVSARFAQTPQVKILRASSSDAASSIPAGLDWVYIDGDHRYEAVREDLEVYSKLVGPGGLVGGDDYKAGGWYGDAVQRAVNEFIGTNRAEILFVRGNEYLLRMRC